MIENKKVWVSVNAGSSSIKLDVFDAETQQKLLSLAVENIAQTNSVVMIVRDAADTVRRSAEVADRPAAIKLLFETFDQEVQNTQVVAVGHRVVHGGLRTQSAVINNDLLAELEQLAPFDPEHMPAALELITSCQAKFVDAAHVACFDTAFFADLPEVAQVLPLPNKYANLGLKRYGFHGLSYGYLTTKLYQVCGQDTPSKIVYAHLGSGASLAAVQDGRPVDTTMSFTPASGIVMSTRSGDIDPGIVLFLQQKAGLSVEEFTHMVNHESGLLGVSGQTAEMKTLVEQYDTNHLARLAVDLFCYKVRMAIGSLSAAMGGIDALVFSGGIGERSAFIRAKVIEPLGYLGFMIDDTKNKASQQQIHAPDSKSIFVLQTDESQTIIEELHKTLNKQEGR